MKICTVNVFDDNKGATKLVVNKHASRRTKHINVKHHLVRDAYDAGKARRVVYVRAEDQLADLFILSR